MRRDGIRGEGPHRPLTKAEELGWDDSLYDDAPAPEAGPVPDQDVAADRGRIPGQRAPEESGTGSGPDAPPPPSSVAGREGAHGPDIPAEAGPLPADAAAGTPAEAGAGPRPENAVDGPAVDGEPDATAAEPAPSRRARASQRRAARPRWVRVLRGTAAALVLLLLGAGAAGFLYLRHLNDNITKEELHLGGSQLDKAPPNEAGQTPLNILVLGSDSRNSEENISLGGSRADADRKPLADSQILVHVSADRSHMTALSIPRDTRVTTPECRDPNDGTVYPETDTKTINTTLQNGGPGCTVAAWERLTGVPIDHFMMVDFAGVVSMADAVGGVPVCVEDNIYDSKSGLRLEKGTHAVKGEQALQWLRTRYGFENGSDVGRAKAHQMYFTSMMRELQAGTKLTDPGKLMNLAESATSALTVDTGLGTVNRLYDLGEDLKDVPSQGVTMVTMPWVPDPMDPGAHVVPVEDEAERIFSALRNDVALDDEDGQAEAEKAEEAAAKEAERETEAEASEVARAEVAVSVRNGTGTALEGPVTGRAGAVTETLRQLGYTQAVTDNSPSSQVDTTLQYPGEQHRAAAEALAADLGLPDSALRATPDVATLSLVVGADWREGDAYPDWSRDSVDSDANASEEDGEKESILDGHDTVAGDDDSACMAVNSVYTW